MQILVGSEAVKMCGTVRTQPRRTPLQGNESSDAHDKHTKRLELPFNLFLLLIARPKGK